MAAVTSPARTSRRVSYIDGLRGVAILMVLLYHAWYVYISGVGVKVGSLWWYGQIPLPLHRPIYEAMISRGYQGVSLFFVLSGFCLSYPLWRARADGKTTWFRPSSFFARRCLRILPPYYVAFALCLAVDLLLTRWGMHLAAGSTPRNLADLVSQLLLLHNVMSTPWVNGSFWSLGAEWQWYWVFPLVLVLCARSPAIALPVTLSVSVAWFSVFSSTTAIALMPQRLFELSCGMTVAWMVVHQVRIHRWAVAGTIALSIALAEAVRPATSLGLHQPLYGIAFGGLVLLAHGSSRFRRVLSWRPLVGLGMASYSVYLVHQPVVEAAERFAPSIAAASPLVMLPAVAGGITAGALFYFAVERPLTGEVVKGRLLPPLTTALVWTDFFLGRVGQRGRGIGEQIDETPVVEGARPG